MQASMGFGGGAPATMSRQFFGGGGGVTAQPTITQHAPGTILGAPGSPAHAMTSFANQHHNAIVQAQQAASRATGSYDPDRIFTRVYKNPLDYQNNVNAFVQKYTGGSLFGGQAPSTQMAPPTQQQVTEFFSTPTYGGFGNQQLPQGPIGAGWANQMKKNGPLGSVSQQPGFGGTNSNLGYMNQWGMA